MLCQTLVTFGITYLLLRLAVPVKIGAVFMLSIVDADPEISHFHSKKCKFKVSGLHGRVAT